MMNLLAILILLQLGLLFLKRTLIGRLTYMIFKTFYKLTKTILLMDLKFVYKIYRIVARENKKYQIRRKKQHKQPVKKAVGCDNVVDFKKYKSKKHV